MKTYLLVLTSLELGGAERQALNFARYLRKEGRRVIIVGITNPGKVCDICAAEEIPCIPMLEGHSTFKKFLYLINVFTSIVLKKSLWMNGVSLSYRIARLIKKEKVDICISYCSPANTILGYAKKFYRDSKYIWYQRDAGLCDEPWEYRDKALHLNDLVLANSNSGREWLKRNHNIEAMVVHNGVLMDLPKKSSDEWRHQLQIDESQFVCTMIANLSSTKNHLILLKAWKYMREHNIGQNIVLVFAGRFDEQYSNLLHFVEENNLTKNVRFLGQIDDIVGLLSVTTLSVFGAISEGNPNGIIESALASQAVVATDLPEIREVVAEQNYKYLFKEGDIEAIVANVMCLIKDKDLRNHIGRMNKEKALKMFSFESNFRKMIDTLEEL